MPRLTRFKREREELSPPKSLLDLALCNYIFRRNARAECERLPYIVSQSRKSIICRTCNFRLYKSDALSTIALSRYSPFLFSNGSRAFSKRSRKQSIAITAMSAGNSYRKKCRCLF